MLEYMQKNMRWFLLPFAFLIIVVFVFWGVGRQDQGGQRVVLAEIGDAKVYVDEYWRTYDRMVKFYRSIFQDRLDAEMEKTLNLKERALDELIDREVLVAQAAKLGISVTDAEVAEAIKAEQSFQREGRFDRDVYLRTLELNRLSPAFYEESRRTELTMAKIRRLLAHPTPLDRELSSKEDWKDSGFVSVDRISRAFLDGLRRQMNVVVNRDLISSS